MKIFLGEIDIITQQGRDSEYINSRTIISGKVLAVLYCQLSMVINDTNFGKLISEKTLVI